MSSVMQITQTSSISELIRSRRCFSMVLWLVSFGAPAQQHWHIMPIQAVGSECPCHSHLMCTHLHLEVLLLPCPAT